MLSAAIAFRAFLFLVPYVFFCVVTFGLAAGTSSEDPTDLARSVGVSGLMARTFASAANLDTWNRVWAICVSGFAMFLAARALVKVLRITHGLVWRVPVPKLSSSNAAAALAIGLVSTQLLVGGGIAWIRQQSLLLGILSLLLSMGLVFGLYLFTSRLLPHAECPWWALAPGAALVAVGTTGLQAATVFYFAGSIERKSDTYRRDRDVARVVAVGLHPRSHRLGGDLAQRRVLVPIRGTGRTLGPRTHRPRGPVGRTPAGAVDLTTPADAAGVERVS